MRQSPAIEGAPGRFAAPGRQSPPAVPGTAVGIALAGTTPGHGGPREKGPRGGVGGSAAVGTKVPWPQCVQRVQPIRSMRRRKAATDSTITGSGAGTASAARACARRAALPAGPSRP